MRISRRAVLRFTGGLACAAAIPAEGRTREAQYLTTAKDRHGQYQIAVLDGNGEILAVESLPGRGHGTALRPGTNEAVVFARRPGRFAFVFRLRDGRKTVMPDLPDGRHFNGHGVFSPDGRVLYTSENDFCKGRGVIGMWDAAQNYRRIGEMPSHGVGPHELAFMPDGRTIAVANGGVMTHPDTGRRQLNLDEMYPSLAFVQVADGACTGRAGFLESRFRKLSVRHIAAARNGTVCVALQDKGPWHEGLPLVAFYRLGADRLVLSDMPAVRRMQGYMGAVTLDVSQHSAAVSAPRGGYVTFWDMHTGRYRSSMRLPDGCGVAPTALPDVFLITSGNGRIVRYDAAAGKILESWPSSGRHWDNHVTKVSSY